MIINGQAISPSLLGSLGTVAEFHYAFGHPIQLAPVMPDEKTRRLRVALLYEEVKEFADACGVPSEFKIAPLDEILPNHAGFVNMVEAADALGDIRYVTDGANLVFGFPADSIFEAIHKSNMSKLGADGKPIYREDKKVMKGPNYYKPTADITAILTRLK